MTPELGLKQELDPEFLDVIRGFASSYYARNKLDTFANWSVEDLVHEMVVAFKRRIDDGTLFERVNRDFLHGRLIDAVRRLERGNPKFQGRRRRHYERSLVYSDDLASFIDTQTSDSGKRETADGTISFSEALEQVEEPQSPAEMLRKKFEDEGCLWTRAFHEHLEQSIEDMIREGASKLRKKPDREDLSETVIQRWIEKNPGENPTNRWLAAELGMQRETVTRNIKILIDQGRIIRKPSTIRGKVGECRTRGRWSYHPMAPAKAPEEPIEQQSPSPRSSISEIGKGRGKDDLAEDEYRAIRTVRA